MGAAVGWQDGEALVEAQVSVLYLAAPPRVRRRRLAAALVAAARSGAPVTLCAAAGSGATSLLRDLAALWREEGGEVRFVSLHGAPGAEVPALLRRVREALLGAGDLTLLLVDDLPDLEEFVARDAACELELLARIVPTVCAMGTGAELLVEALGDHPSWNTEGLGVRYDEAAQWHTGVDESNRSFQEHTGGIVALAEASWADAREGLGDAGPRYEEQRSRILCAAVRGALIGEERRLRAAMAMLGSGSLRQLRGLGIACSHELVASSRDEAPVLGVQGSGSLFSVVGGPVCPAPVTELCGAQWPDLACDVVALHLEEGRLEQAIAVAHGCVDAPGLEGILSGRWAELWDAGGRPLMEELAARHPEGAAAIALAIFSGEEPDEPPDDSPCWEPVRALAALGVFGGRGHLALLGGSRRGSFREVPGAEGGSAGHRCMTALWSLWETRRALAAGELNTAAALATRGLAVAGDETLVGALLTQDLYLAAAGLGDASESLRARARDGLRLLRERGEERLWLRETARQAVADRLNGEKPQGAALAEALSVAVRDGDVPSRGCALLAQGLGSLADGEFSAARSRGHEAMRLGEGCGCAPLREGGAALALLAEVPLGLEPQLEGPLTSPDLCLLAECVAGSPEEGRPGPVLAHRDAAPHGYALTLLRGVLARQGRGQDALWAALPAPWREAHGARAAAPVPRGVQPPLPVGVSADAPLLQVSVLGGFALKVGNRTVDPAEFRRVGARNLLALLAVRTGHQVTRTELAGELWPQSPSDRARRNLYSAISCARKGLGERDYGPRHLLVARDLVALNPDTVTVDIDGFEALLERSRVSEATDAERVSLAERAQAQYRGGSYVAETGVPGLQSYHDWLETRYVECLLAGARSALRLRKAHIARGFAREAAERAPCMEEAARLLIESLVREGRPLEARRAYDRFSRAVGEIGLPVPESLQALREALDGAQAASVELVA